MAIIPQVHPLCFLFSLLRQGFSLAQNSLICLPRAGIPSLCDLLFSWVGGLNSGPHHLLNDPASKGDDSMTQVAALFTARQTTWRHKMHFLVRPVLSAK